MTTLGGNYWLNLIYFEELIDLLADYLKPIKYQRFSTENHVKLTVNTLKDKFFKMPEHSKYVKFHGYVMLELFVNEFVDDDGIIFFKVDNLILKII